MTVAEPKSGAALSKRSSVSSRLASLHERITWLTPLAGSRVRALQLVVAMRLRQAAIHRAYFLGHPVDFRTHDAQALREVLVDLEYAFLVDLFEGQPSPTVLDVGAHIGTLPIWLFSLRPQARVLSVEADPETFKVLSRNTAMAAEGGAQWEVLHGAAGATQGEIVFLSNAGPSMSHRIDSSGTVPVPTMTLTALLDRIAGQGQNVDLLKVDIEGSEERFLCAAPEALRRVKSLVVELHPSLCNTERVEALLKQCFDDIRPIGGRMSTKPLLYCTRREDLSQQ